MYVEKTFENSVNPKILIIDDSQMFRKSINAILKPLTENINRTLYCFLYSLALTELISISMKHFGVDFDKIKYY